MARRILVADDDNDLRHLLETALTFRGFKVVAAADGAEVVRLAVANPPDVIVLDINMPVMDGLEACRQLRSQPVPLASPSSSSPNGRNWKTG